MYTLRRDVPDAITTIAIVDNPACHNMWSMHMGGTLQCLYYYMAKSSEQVSLQELAPKLVQFPTLSVFIMTKDRVSRC